MAPGLLDARFRGHDGADRCAAILITVRLGSDVASQHGRACAAIPAKRKKLSDLQSLSWQGHLCPHLILRKGAMPPTGY
jgi:hypothetical protein